MCSYILLTNAQEQAQYATRLVTVLGSLLRIGHTVEVSHPQHSDGSVAGGPLSAARTAFVQHCNAALQPVLVAGCLNQEAAREAGQHDVVEPDGLASAGEDCQPMDVVPDAPRPAEAPAESADGDDDEEVRFM